MQKNLLLFLLAFSLLPSILIAQSAGRKITEKCGTMQLLESRLARNPELRTKFEKERASFSQAVNNKTYRLPETVNNTTSRTVATIPVVFHIVTTNPNSVTDAQIQAQLDTLNRDYAGVNGDSTLIPSYFKSLFGKSGIQFCLAQRTPTGDPTNGIERITTTKTSFSIDNTVKHATTGGADIWDGSSYLNVWVCVLSNNLLGYATFPTDGVPSEQGVVVDYRSLPGGSQTNYNTGKTLTHETGHYFNLYHIWGDDNGACTGSDDVDDTPNQADQTNGCNTGIKRDSCTSTGNGIMYQNYMDYSYDRCLVMFTTQQVTRMETAFMTYRSSLLSSKGCLQVVPNTTNNAQLFSINQPSQRICANTFTPSIIIKNRGAQTLTALTINARIDNGAVTSYTWNGSLAYLATTAVTMPVLTTGTGNHTLTIYITNPNNRQDEDITNDTLSSRYQFYTPVTSVKEGFEANTYPPTAWDVVNVGNGITWQRIAGVAKTGVASIMIDNFNNAVVGERDDLRLPTATLQNVDSAFLSFQVAAATFTDLNQANNPWDTLEVLASTDCGVTYSSLYKKWGRTLVTRQTATTDEFVPSPTEWRKDSIDLNSLIGAGNVLLAFRNTNGYENNIYLDDVNLRTVIINPNLKRLGFLVTPSPTSGVIAVQFYPQPTNLSAIQIYDITGQKLRELTINNGQASNYYSFDLGPYAAGTYVVRAVFTDRVVTRKIMKY